MIYRNIIAKFVIVSSLFIAGCSKNSSDSTFPTLKYNETKISFADFIGSDQCQACHADIYEQWKGSSHALAGGPATANNIIAPFNGQPIVLDDVVVYPEQVGSTYRFRMVTPTGDIKQTIDVEFVVGKGLMYGGGTQTFFGKYEDGTYRFLPFDYSKHEDSWFVQLKSDEKWVKIRKDIKLDDLYNWPPHRTLGEINDISNCQQCHGSQIIAKKVNDVYDVKFTSLSINCESCHGPAKEHATIMSGIVNNVLNNNQGIGIKTAVGLSTDESLNMCFQCHAVKTPIREDYLPGENGWCVLDGRLIHKLEEQLLKNSNYTQKLNFEVNKVDREKNKIVIISTNQEQIECDKLIVATQPFQALPSNDVTKFLSDVYH